MVCSITRGPAKPMSAPGSAMIQIAQHGEAGGDAAGSGIGENADVRQARLVELHQPGGDFRHLHEADGAFLHTRAAGSGHHDERVALVERAIDGAGNLLAHYRAHAAADEFRFHDAQLHGAAGEFPFGGDEGVGHVRRFLRCAQTFAIGLGIDEAKRVGRREAGVELAVLAIVEQQLQAGERRRCGCAIRTWCRHSSWLPVPSSR
jgi:hypothetical protein